MTFSHSLMFRDLMASAIKLVKAVDASKSDAEGWSPIVILGHCSDVDEQVWLSRINLMVKAYKGNLPIPSLVWWEPDAIATERNYRDFSLDQVTARLFESRAKIIRTLSDLSADEWYAPALHDTFGTLTVHSLPEKILLHDEEHLASMQ